MSSIQAMTEAARRAAIELGVMPDADKNRALQAIRSALIAEMPALLEANQADLNAASETGLSPALTGRLRFDSHKADAVCMGLEQLSALPDPVGRTLMGTALSDGLELYRVSCPIGVIGVIFESRPDALVQIASLCLKSGNAVLLKGGKEAHHTNRALAQLIRRASVAAGCPPDWIHLLESHADVGELLDCHDSVDLLIPRGSNAFVQYIMQHTRIPVLGHADGVCHTYIDVHADPDLALAVALDAKTQSVSVCNATETILLHRALPEPFVRRLIDALRDRAVAVYGDADLSAQYGLEPVAEWHHEYLDLAVSLALVDDVQAAVAHINRYGSGHTEAILTADPDAAQYFLDMVDAGNVYLNCSTRFSDGFRYGFGAEVGVSTSKIHARGPVGLEGLLTYKYKLFGRGDRVAPFVSGERVFAHRPLDGPCPKAAERC